MQETDLIQRKRVPPEGLRRAIGPAELSFETTAEVGPLTGTIGQQRALQAIRTGLDMDAPGFNIFAAGQVGTGRNSAVKALVTEKAGQRSAPDDWCYVYSFEKPDTPVAVKLPAGKGNELAADMEALIEECKTEIPKAFAGEQYEKQRNEVVQDLQEERGELMSELNTKARELGYAIRLTSAGIVATPMVDGEPISQEAFEQLPEKKRQELRKKGEKVQELIAETVSRGRQLEKEAKQKASGLDEKVGLFTVGHLIDDLKAKYTGFPKVVSYLQAVREDVIENIELFKDAEGPPADLMGMRMPPGAPYGKYRVNVVVDNSHTEGAPVVDERNPTYYHLFGQLEYRAQLGGMVTDFTMIKAGAFQRASGGYLILQALDVLRNPFAWESLKRAIRTGEVKIENMWEQYMHAPAATLRPEPIPVDVKVLLVGSPMLYYLLYLLDEDFQRLFKVRADFDVEMDLNQEHLDRYAAFVSERCAEARLPPFDAEAVALVTEQGLRLASHQRRLSTRFLRVADLVAEAGELARSTSSDTVTAEHVQKAIDARQRRSRMIQDKIQRDIKEGVLLIDTDGACKGQVNGLAVYDLGDYSFGKPSRITCIISVGRAGVVNIERESKMSGRIHDKGVLILSGYLASRFGQDKPLSVSASLCFEQSYSEVEGDSASCAELYALLSALADVPLRQDIAVTGSVNQRGDVQPIGGVNEKIEGFFEVCRDKGLTGRQGVLIPARNLDHLMLKNEVVEAVRKDRFHVYAVDTVEEGIEILTGLPAGTKSEEGQYPEETVFGLADRRLWEMAEVMRRFGPPVHEEERKTEESPHSENGD